LAFVYDAKKPLLVDKDHVNKKLSWYSTDSIDIYPGNVRDNGPAWRWKDVKIEYKFNSLGYRSKEINEVDNNFILGFGCSYTEGVGIHEQDVWLPKVANRLGMDYINLAKQSSGMDIQAYNAVLYKNSGLRLPKLVVVQWPQMFRLSFGSYVPEFNHTELWDRSYEKSVDGKWWTKRYIQDPGHMKLNVLSWYHTFNNVWQSLGVPVVNFSWEEDLVDELQYSAIPCNFVDPEGVGSTRARDCCHDAPEFHDLTVEKLFDANVF
jgi:hypothetical protein